MRRTQRAPWTSFLVDSLAGVAILGISGLALSVVAAPHEVGTDRSDRPAQIQMVAAEEARTITVTGRIEAAEKDVRGMTTALQIADEAGGGRYLIAKDARGKELLSHVGKLAVVKGVLQRETPGQPVLVVQSFRLQES